MQKILFYNKFIIYLYMFRAPCSHHQGSKVCYRTAGIITPVGGRPVHRVLSQPVHRTATYRVWWYQMLY